MSKEARKSIRRPLSQQGAVLSDHTLLSACTVLDVSASGARIQLQTPNDIPDKFILLLSKNGKVRRQCQVVRRTEIELGVRFVLDASKKNE